MRTPAESFGSGRGMAHVPRENGQGRRVPQTVGGRKAHPPKAEKDQGKEINDKERKLATRSAIAATVDAEVVRERGHEFDDDVELPLVVADEFEDLVKTREVVETLEALGVYDDIERADEGKTVKSGQGKTRGRKYRRPSSILFVTSDEPSKAARNLAGADVATAADVNAEDLAPGTHAGRLTVWTESALEEVAER
jgi:large subunit ribosomal protein L4e